MGVDINRADKIRERNRLELEARMDEPSLEPYPWWVMWLVWGVIPLAYAVVLYLLLDGPVSRAANQLGL